jgi:hypothetical protein
MEAWINGLLISHTSCHFDKTYSLFIQVLLFMETNFSKQNAIKNQLWASLKLDTLDALMKVSLYNIKMDNMDWNAIFEVWGTWKHQNL